MSHVIRQPLRTFDTNTSASNGKFDGRTSSPTLPSYRRNPDRESPLDITQKLEKGLAHLSASNNVFKRWMYEIISLTISALSIGAIVGILLYLNNRSLTKWPSGLTVIAVLSKIASAALILPVSEALGQLKWNWFNGKKSREAWDFEIFDKASRGAWGSILLLFRTRGRSLAALGALLTLLLLATDTFFQQLVDLPERWHLEGNSSIATVVNYDPNKDTPVAIQGGQEIMQLDQNLMPTAQKFLYGNGTQPIPFGNGSSPEIPVSCPTSNCTWPTYRTLGTCSQCTELDVSQLLTFACKTTKVDWIANLTGLINRDKYPIGSACGYFFNATSEAPILMSGYSTSDMNSTEGEAEPGEALLMRAFPLVSLARRQIFFDGSFHYKHIRHKIVDVVVAAAANGTASVYRNETPILHECTMYWCVKDLHSSYYWASYEEDVVQTVTNTTPGNSPWVFRRYLSHSLNGTFIEYEEDIAIQVEDKIYGVSNKTHLQAANIMVDVFPSFLTAKNLTAQPNYRTRTDYDTPARFRLLTFNPWIPPNNLTRHMERFATALTSALRSSSSNEMVTGSAYSVETFVRVQWAWLTFPSVLLVLTVAFLVATMVKTAKRDGETDLGIWKTSAMPALIYGLPSPMQSRFNSSTWSSDTRGKSRNIRVRLHPDKGWRLSGRQCDAISPAVAVQPRRPPPGWI